jgi:hypothetical protein
MKAKESYGMESHALLSACFKKLGIKHCATELGLSAPLLYKWCEPNKGTEDSGAVNPLDRVAQIVRLTDDRTPIDWLCTQAGGVFVPDALGNKCTLPALIQQTHKILKEFADLINVISVGMADDGRIDRDESNRIREEWQQMKTIVEGFVRACEKGLYETQH